MITNHAIESVYTPLLLVEEPVNEVPMTSEPKPMPTFEEVMAYAKKYLKFYSNKYAYGLPKEQLQEIEQEGYERVWDAYKKLNPDKGWKSYMQLHCMGAVKDYLKSGLRDTESEFGQDRVEVKSKDDGTVLGIDETAGFYGVFAELFTNDKKMTPNWDLLSRLVGHNKNDGENLHIVCKVLLGYSQESIAEQFGDISRERISQRVREFMMKLDDPDYMANAFVNQCVFALGLSGFFHCAEVDSGLGWDLQEFDLNATDSFARVRTYYAALDAHKNPSLFDFAEGMAQ